MQRQTWIGVSLGTGALAGAAAYLLVAPVVEPALAAFAAGLNALVWTVAAAVTIYGYDSLGVVGRAPGGDQSAAMKWGAIVGSFTSAGVTGVMGVSAAVLHVRFAAVLALIVFGFGLGALTLGMAVAAQHFDRPDAAGAPAGGSPSAAD